MHAKKPKLRHRQINHVGLNTSFSEIFALYILSKRALVLKNFWTTNIWGIHIVTLLVVKCGDEITPKFLKPGKILQRLEATIRPFAAAWVQKQGIVHPGFQQIHPTRRIHERSEV